MKGPGIGSNVLKHANDLIRYIDKCFAVVRRLLQVRHSCVPLPAVVALSRDGSTGCRLAERNCWSLHAKMLTMLRGLHAEGFRA